jgi:hypothetical protein
MHSNYEMHAAPVFHSCEVIFHGCEAYRLLICDDLKGWSAGRLAARFSQIWDT